MHPLNQYINKDLLRHARLLHAMTLSISTKLPDPVADHCWVGGINGETLVIITDSGNWVVSVRYQQHELLKQLNCEFRSELGQTLKRVKIKVSVFLRSEKKPTRKPSLSMQNAQLLASTASNINDPDIRGALLHLAMRGKPTPKHSS